MRLVVGRIGRPHGLRGDVTVEVRTDFPEERFAAGQVVLTDDPEREQLLVDTSRWQGDRLLVRFAGTTDRTAAEKLRGLLLSVDADTSTTPPDPDEYFDWQLEGLTCWSLTGERLGVVREVIHLPGQDLLAVVPGTAEQSTEVLVPLVAQMVPSIDLANRRIVLDPAVGLFEPTDGNVEDRG
ncbi:MAG: ribosome maturation factor RimM [Actinobacteria bacterium]|nr:ribosome maturation factor RimM [Actinomycetota bacterium]MCB9412875.1 ribosome maturation factor RimM [Actinomycetota bacterium]